MKCCITRLFFQFQLIVRQLFRKFALPVFIRRWETEAKIINCSGQIELLYQLFRFRFYNQIFFFHNALQNCEMSRLNEIFARFTDKKSVPECQHAQMVEKIVNLVEPTCHFPNFI